MRTVLVTGGCGFIGSHFVRRLLKSPGWRVVNLDVLTYAGDLHRLEDVQDPNCYRFVRGDIGDRTLLNVVLQEERPWAIVNFAAESHVDRSILDPSPFLRTNVAGVHALLEAVRGISVNRFLHISTDEVYGDAEGKDRFDEEAPLAPSSPYSASKAAADLLCLAYRRTFDVPVVIMRSCNNYGPFQFPEKLIPLTIRNLLNGQTVPVYGDGGQRREWLYVEDNVEAALQILEKGRIGAIYNVSAAEEWTNLEVVQALSRSVAAEMQLDPDELLKRIKFVPDRPGHDRRYAITSRRIWQELGWVPSVSFEEGLKQTVRWYLDCHEWVRRVTSGEYQDYYSAVYTHCWAQRNRTSAT